MSDLQSLEPFVKSLEDKDLRGLRSELYRLKRAVRDAKKGVESGQDKRSPAWTKELDGWRCQMEAVKAAMDRLGVSYKTTVLEEEAEDFLRKIPAIRHMDFSLNDFMKGMFSWHFDLTQDPVRVRCEARSPGGSQPAAPASDYELGREDFRAQLRLLRMGEWRRTYSPEHFGYTAAEGAAWNLEISYGPGEKMFRVRGSNAYPWNFDDWTRLLPFSPELKKDWKFSASEKRKAERQPEENER